MHRHVAAVIPTLRTPFPLSASALRRNLVVLATVLSASLLPGCQVMETYMPTMRSFGVYKLDINQGNYLTQDMVEKLKVGQSKQQVRLILGTPLVTSAFRDNRWDYVYEFNRQGKTLEHRQFVVYFVDDKLARWEGDEMPISAAALNRAAADKSLGHIPSADDKGIFGRIWEILSQ
jgi:outer membrane protein assembly factor BamE